MSQIALCRVTPEVRVARSALNYLGQLRLYSYVDLLLLLLAIGATRQEVAQCSLLWFGFLIHLEWRHRDRGRLTWPWQGWAAIWVVGACISLSPSVVPFFVLAILYSNKKAINFVAAVSPLVNGAIKGSLALLVFQAAWPAIAVVIALTAVRNLAGDFRDTVKDRNEGVTTIPVRCGVGRDIPWLYPVGLVVTSAFWVWWGALPAWYLLAAVAVQGATYKLTPR